MRKALASLPWVRKVLVVDYDEKLAVVTVEASRYDEKALLGAVEKAGYGGKVLK